MKAFRKIGLFFLSLTFAVAILGCDKKTTTTTTPAPVTTTTSELSEMEVRLHSIYQLGFSSGAITESYEDWLASIRGENGEDGREVLLRVSGGYIQWQYSGDASWQNLIAVASLTGPAGTNGTNGTNGTDGTNGDDGREVTFRISEGYLQWQYVGDTVWTNLLSLAEIAGTDGTDGEDGTTPTIAISPDGFWVINGLKTEFRAVPAEVPVSTVDLWFDLNGGTLDSAVAAQYLDIPKGDTVTLPIPEKHGYVFAGWFTGDTVNDGQFLNTSVAAKDLTLHARWAQDTRGIQLLLSQLISGTNFVLDYTETAQSDDTPDSVRHVQYSSSVDETGRIHRLETGVILSGTDPIGSEFRSSIVIDGYEYYYHSEDDGEWVTVGKRLADGQNRKKVSWDVPNVDSLYEYFRIEDFRIRADEFVFDYVPSDDGLIAYAHNVAGSDVDDENLKAVFYGDTGIFEITIPQWDDAYESIDCVVVQTFRLVSVGTSTNRFLFDEYKAEIRSEIAERADSRIAQILPTDATQYPFIDLKTQLVWDLGLITDPVLLWDAYIEGIYQLETFPLMTDPQKVAAEAAKALVDAKLAELSLSATEASILAMQAIVPALKAEILPASQAVLDGVLAYCYQELETLYVADPVKIAYSAAKERVFAYLGETHDFFLYVTDGPGYMAVFDACLQAAEAEIEAATTEAQVLAVWDGFGASLQSAGLIPSYDYQDELSARYESLRMTYLEMTLNLYGYGTSWSKAFDLEALSALTPLETASVYDFMHGYIYAKEELATAYRDAALAVAQDRTAALQLSVQFKATPSEALLFLSTTTSAYQLITNMATGDEVLAGLEDLFWQVLQLPFSDLTADKLFYMESLQSELNTLSVTADSASRTEMTGLTANYDVFLCGQELTSEEVSDAFYAVWDNLHAAYVPDQDAILLEEARKETLQHFQQLKFLYTIATNYMDTPFMNDVDQAIHETLIATDISVLSAVGGDLLARIAFDPTFVSIDVANEMLAILDESLSQWESHLLEVPSTLTDQFDAFSLYVTAAPAFGSAFTQFSTLFSTFESAFWTAYSQVQIDAVDYWHLEKSAIVEVGYLPEVDSLHARTVLFLGLSTDEGLWDLIMTNYQNFLISCPTDPLRQDRWTVSSFLQNDIDGYAKIVTSASLSAMISLYDEFVGLLETETDRDAMDLLYDEYAYKLFEVYEEDPAKAAFLNLKEYYGLLFSVFGDIFYRTITIPTPEQSALENQFYAAIYSLDALPYSLDAPTLLLNSIGELVGLYLTYGGTTFELANLDYLSDQIEYFFYDYATGGSPYLEDQATAMNALRAAAQADLVATSDLFGAMNVYADYVMQMKALAMNAHRDALLASMLSQHDDMYYRLVPADRTAFTNGYLGFKTRLQNALRESSFDIIEWQYGLLLNFQVPDPVLNAKRDAIAYIQQWLLVQWTIATDDSRTAMYAAQTAAYDAIYAATTIDEVTAAIDAGMIALDEALVEDPARLSLYGEEMSLAAIELSQLLTDITDYADDIRNLNQAVVIVMNARLAVWTANDSVQLAAIVNQAKADLAALPMNWDPAKLEECRSQYLAFMGMILNSFGGSVPAPVQASYDATTTIIGGATSPLVILETYYDYCAVVEANR